MVITILIITTMMKMITIIVIIMMIFLIKIIMMMMIRTMLMIMIAMVTRQLYATQCNFGELQITPGHWSMTRGKRSMTESNFLQLIHYYVNPTTKLDYVSLFHENIHILSQNPHRLYMFKSFRKDIMEH